MASCPQYIRVRKCAREFQIDIETITVKIDPRDRQLDRRKSRDQAEVTRTAVG